MTYCFVHQMSYYTTKCESSIELVGDIYNFEKKQLTTSTETVCDHKHYCHEICLNSVFDKSSEMVGDLVNIDESKFGINR